MHWVLLSVLPRYIIFCNHFPRKYIITPITNFCLTPFSLPIRFFFLSESVFYESNLMVYVVKSNKPCIYFAGRKKSNSIEPEVMRSPAPSIALSVVSGSSKLDEISIQEHLSVFYFGQNGSGKSPSGRRYSHPNQIKWVEEYESQRRASTTSTSPLPATMSSLSVNKASSPPPSPVMQFPVIPPGIKIN